MSRHPGGTFSPASPRCDDGGFRDLFGHLRGTDTQGTPRRTESPLRVLHLDQVVRPSASEVANRQLQDVIATQEMEIQQLKQDLQARERDCEDATTRRQETQERYHSALNHTAMLKEKVAHLQREEEHAKITLEKTVGEVHQLGDRNAKLLRALQATKIDLQRRGDELAAKDERIRQQDNSLRELETELDRLTAGIEARLQADDEMKELSSHQLEIKEAECQALKVLRVRLEQRCVRWRQRCRALDSRRESIAMEKEDSDIIIVGRVRRMCAEHEEHRRSQAHQCDALSATIQEYADQNDTLQCHVREMEKTIHKLLVENERNHVTGEEVKAALHQCQEDLQNREEDLVETQRESQRQQMEAARKLSNLQRQLQAKVQGKKEVEAEVEQLAQQVSTHREDKVRLSEDMRRKMLRLKQTNQGLSEVQRQCAQSHELAAKQGAKIMELQDLIDELYHSTVPNTSQARNVPQNAQHRCHYIKDRYIDMKHEVNRIREEFTQLHEKYQESTKAFADREVEYEVVQRQLDDERSEWVRKDQQLEMAMQAVEREKTLQGLLEAEMETNRRHRSGSTDRTVYWRGALHELWTHHTHVADSFVANRAELLEAIAGSLQAWSIAERDCREAQQSLSDARHEVETTRTTMEQLEVDLVTHQNTAEALREELHEAGAELARRMAEVQQGTELKARCHKRDIKQREDIKKMEGEVEDLREELRSARCRATKQEKLLTTKTETLRTLQDRHKTVVQEFEEFKVLTKQKGQTQHAQEAERDRRLRARTTEAYSVVKTLRQDVCELSAAVRDKDAMVDVQSKLITALQKAVDNITTVPSDDPQTIVVARPDETRLMYDEQERRHAKDRAQWHRVLETASHQVRALTESLALQLKEAEVWHSTMLSHSSPVATTSPPRDVRLRLTMESLSPCADNSPTANPHLTPQSGPLLPATPEVSPCPTHLSGHSTPVSWPHCSPPPPLALDAERHFPDTGTPVIPRPLSSPNAPSPNLQSPNTFTGNGTPLPSPEDGKGVPSTPRCDHQREEMLTDVLKTMSISYGACKRSLSYAQSVLLESVDRTQHFAVKMQTDNTALADLQARYRSIRHAAHQLQESEAALRFELDETHVKLEESSRREADLAIQLEGAEARALQALTPIIPEESTPILRVDLAVQGSPKPKRRSDSTRKKAAASATLVEPPPRADSYARLHGFHKRA